MWLVILRPTPKTTVPSPVASRWIFDWWPPCPGGIHLHASLVSSERWFTRAFGQVAKVLENIKSTKTHTQIQHLMHSFVLTSSCNSMQWPSSIWLLVIYCHSITPRSPARLLQTWEQSGKPLPETSLVTFNDFHAPPLQPKKINWKLLLHLKPWKTHTTSTPLALNGFRILMQQHLIVLFQLGWLCFDVILSCCKILP